MLVRRPRLRPGERPQPVHQPCDARMRLSPGSTWLPCSVDTAGEPEILSLRLRCLGGESSGDQVSPEPKGFRPPGDRHTWSCPSALTGTCALTTTCFQSVT